MGVVFESETNIGNKRQINEDSLWPQTIHHSHQPDEPWGMLFIVADGMGGHGAGDVASELAVKVISTTYYSLGDEVADIGQRLNLALTEAHQQICSQAAASPEYENMGTTVVAVVVKYDEVYEEGELWVAWAGDSRVYLLRRGRLQQLSRDHSRVWPLIESGQITWDELRFHPERSKVTNALTARRATIIPEIERFDLEPGDQILLCSDGLPSEVRPETMQQILSTYPPQQAMPLLIEQANAPKEVLKNGKLVKLEGGNDNISSILINIPSGEPQPSPPTLVTRAPAVPARPPRLGWLIAGILVAVVLVGAGVSLALFGLNQAGLSPANVVTAAAVVPAPPPVSATQLPDANVLVIEPTSTHTPPPSPTVPATQAPVVEARIPTVTRAPTSTPTFTPVPPTATPFITLTPTITAEINPADFAVPVLIAPEGYQQGQPDFMAGKEITFAWQWPGELPQNFGFEILLWLGNDKKGLYEVNELKSILQYNPQENHTYSVTLKLAGPGITTTDSNYVWSVGIVQLEPYQWLGVESEQRKISIVVPNPE